MRLRAVAAVVVGRRVSRVVPAGGRRGCHTDVVRLNGADREALTTVVGRGMRLLAGPRVVSGVVARLGVTVMLSVMPVVAHGPAVTGPASVVLCAMVSQPEPCSRHDRRGASSACCLLYTSD